MLIITRYVLKVGFFDVAAKARGLPHSLTVFPAHISSRRSTLGLGLGWGLVSTLSLTLTLKQHSFKKRKTPTLAPAPTPSPRFTDTRPHGLNAWNRLVVSWYAGFILCACLCGAGGLGIGLFPLVWPANGQTFTWLG